MPPFQLTLLPRRFRRNADGSTTIEFSMLALPFFALLLGSIQLIYLMLVQQEIETAAEAIGRQILIGTVQQQNMTKQQFTTLACSLLPSTLDCTKLIIDVQVASTFANATLAKPDLSGVGNPSATTVLTYNPGVAGQIVVLRLLYALPVVKIPGLNLQSASSSFGFAFPMATSVFKNETFS